MASSKKNLGDTIDCSGDDVDLTCSRPFENGHWIWDEEYECLTFVSDNPPEVLDALSKFTIKQNIMFNDDVDLIEQVKYRRRYQRKILPGQPDIITLQDVKDIALYTAPFNILSPTLINTLHTPTTERFLRALIFYCQYFLQVRHELAERGKENKIRTGITEDIEFEYQDNLADLRVLVAKEYSMFIIGGGDLKKFHHMGPKKKSRSLSFRDVQHFITFMRMCVQIVWIALGRREFSILEVEIHRLIKGDKFNDVERTLTEERPKLSAIEKKVLYGDCIKKDRMLNLRSPLSYNIISCERDVDYRMLTFGVVKNKKMSSRLKYMLIAVTGPEEDYEKFKITVGILGKPRISCDTMLNYITIKKNEGSTTSGKSQSMHSKFVSGPKLGGSVDELGLAKLYEDILLPSKYDEDTTEELPEEFPQESPPVVRTNEIQWRKWQRRLYHIMTHRKESETTTRSQQSNLA